MTEMCMYSPIIAYPPDHEDSPIEVQHCCIISFAMFTCNLGKAKEIVLGAVQAPQ